MFTNENKDVVDFVTENSGCDREDIAAVLSINLELSTGKGHFDGRIDQIKKIYARRGDDALVCVKEQYYIVSRTSALFKRLYPEVVEYSTKQIEGRSARLRKLGTNM
jgi:hypothetical protein